MTDRLLRPLTADQLAEIRDWLLRSNLLAKTGIGVPRSYGYVRGLLAERDRLLAENEQLRCERDMLHAPAWDPDDDAWDQTREDYWTIRRKAIAAFEAAPSLDGLLKEKAARDG